MKITDYSQIASKYDNNAYRQKIDEDAVLKDYLARQQLPEYHVLDLACGTGIYLYNQREYFIDPAICWYGLDASFDMLQIARNKIKYKNVSVDQGLAENLPYEANYFDYIVNNFAFQHFTEKAQVLDEVTRVLKVQGVFKMHNIAIHEMKHWWVYKYFPAAYWEDLKRFWDKEQIFQELTLRGFEVEIHITYVMQAKATAELLHYAENRDISVLTLLDDKDYIYGLEQMQAEVYKQPAAKVICDFADLYCIATKH